MIEIIVAPLRRGRRPRSFESAGDRADTVTLTERVFPAESLMFKTRACRFRADMFSRISRSVSFAEGVTTRNQRNRLFIIHRHSPESLANITRRRNRIGISHRSFRVHINQSHLNGGERILKLSITGITLVSEPFALRTPVNVFLRLPNIFTSTGESERLKAH